MDLSINKAGILEWLNASKGMILTAADFCVSGEQYTSNSTSQLAASPILVGNPGIVTPHIALDTNAF